MGGYKGWSFASARTLQSSVLVFIMSLLKYFKKSSVLPNPDGQQTKKSRACLLRSNASGAVINGCGVGVTSFFS